VTKTNNTITPLLTIPEETSSVFQTEQDFEETKSPTELKYGYSVDVPLNR